MVPSSGSDTWLRMRFNEQNSHLGFQMVSMRVSADSCNQNNGSHQAHPPTPRDLCHEAVSPHLRVTLHTRGTAPPII